MAYPCSEYVPPDALKCDPPHCEKYRQTDQYRAWCMCINWKGERIPNCTPKTYKDPVFTRTCYNRVTKEQRNITREACKELGDKDPNWSLTECYCCCFGATADDASINTSEDGAKPIRDVEVTDQVLGASIDLSDGKLALHWVPTEVTFSDGTSLGEDYELIIITYGTGCKLRVMPDQLFLLHSGKLKAARHLTVADLLVDAAGNSVKIVELQRSRYSGSIHHIGLGEMPVEAGVSINGHLYSMGGVTCGDYWLQIMQGSEELSAFLAT
jgi:hypothetical protein